MNFAKFLRTPPVAASGDCIAFYPLPVREFIQLRNPQNNLIYHNGNTLLTHTKLTKVDDNYQPPERQVCNKILQNQSKP